MLGFRSNVYPSVLVDRPPLAVGMATGSSNSSSSTTNSDTPPIQDCTTHSTTTISFSLQRQGDDDTTLQDSDIDYLCQQLRDAMREHKGSTAVSDLKLMFKARKPTLRPKLRKDSDSPSLLSSHTNAISSRVASISSSLQPKKNHGMKETAAVTNTAPRKKSLSQVVKSSLTVPSSMFDVPSSSSFPPPTINAAATKDLALQVETLEREKQELKKKLVEAKRDVYKWKTTCREHEERLHVLENKQPEQQSDEEASDPLLGKRVRVIAPTEVRPVIQEDEVRRLVEETDERNEKQIGRIQELEARNDELLVQLEQSEEEIARLRQQQADSRKGEERKEKAMETVSQVLVEADCSFYSASEEIEVRPEEEVNKSDAALESQLKLVEQIKRGNECESRLDTCRGLVDELRRSKEELRRKLQEQVRIASEAKAQVCELEESVATQQIQIESLAIVNREQRKKLLELSDPSMTSSLESLGSTDDSDTDGDELAVSMSSTKIEALESLWDQQRAQMETIQKDQDKLFRKLGKCNSDATSKIDQLCDSIGGISRDDVSDIDVDESVFDISKDLGVIFEAESEEVDALADDRESPEDFEVAWIQQAEKIESLQRDQDKLLTKLRRSSCDREVKLLSLSESFDEEDLENLKAQRKHQDEIIEGLRNDNESLAQKLEESEAKAAQEIKTLNEQLEAKNEDIGKLEFACEMHDAALDCLKKDKSKLMQQSEKLRDLLKGTEDMSEKQKFQIEQLQKEHEASERDWKTKSLLHQLTRERDLETQKLLREKMEAMEAHQKETMEFLQHERQTAERTLEEERARIRELGAVCAFQKTVIESLQTEKNTVANRLHETEAEFRQHLTKTVSLHEQMAELKSKLVFAEAEKADVRASDVIRASPVERLGGETLNIREVSFQTTEPTLATSFEEDSVDQIGDETYEDHDEHLDDMGSEKCNDETVQEIQDNQSADEMGSEQRDEIRETHDEDSAEVVSLASNVTQGSVTEKETEGAEPINKKLAVEDLLRLLSFSV